MPKQDGDVSEHIERLSSSISKQVTNAKTRHHNFFEDMRDFSEDAGGEADESLDEDEYLLENYFDESYDRSSHQLKFIFYGYKIIGNFAWKAIRYLSILNNLFLLILSVTHWSHKLISLGIPPLTHPNTSGISETNLHCHLVMTALRLFFKVKIPPLT